MQELRESLQHVDSGIFSRIFNTETFGLDQSDNDELIDENAEAEQRQTQPIAHSSNAIDYSDFNEVVPDDQLFSDKYYQRGVGALQKTVKEQSRLRTINDDYDEEEEEATDVTAGKMDFAVAQPTLGQAGVGIQQPLLQPLNKIEMIPPEPFAPRREQVDIKKLFPAFEKGKVLKFSDLFMTNLKLAPKLQPKKRGTSLKLALGGLLLTWLMYSDFWRWLRIWGRTWWTSFVL